jgi:hypothetical protein
MKSKKKVMEIVLSKDCKYSLLCKECLYRAYKLGYVDGGWMLRRKWDEVEG